MVRSTPPAGSAALPADPFALPAAAANPLAQRLANAIRRGGPLPFADFMRAALYDPDLGYYRSGRRTVGRDGDYLTSPEVHPIFGYAIAAVAGATWDALGHPKPFVFREVGPGAGTLAADLLAWIDAHRPDLAAVLRLELVEASGAAREEQRRRLADAAGRVTWHDGLNAAAPVTGVVFANELLDAQPVHRLVRRGAEWHERRVGLDAAGGFTDVEAVSDDARLLTLLADVTASDGQVVEVGLETGPLVATLAAGLRRGLLLLFDYGYPRERLYAPWRKQGTLMTFHHHIPGDDPYARVGAQDLTCHVDVDSVRAAALGAGLAALPSCSQADVLAALGALTTPPAAPAARGAALEDRLARRRAAAILADPAGLGRIQVLAFTREMPPTLPGLGGGEGHA